MSNTRNLGELLQSDGEVPSSKIDSVAASKLTGTVADARLSSTRQAAKLTLSGGAMTGAITTNSTFDGRDVATDGTKLDGIASGANLYVHPNHSGDVVSTADGATVIQVDAVDIPMLSATGTASSTTFLRGDNSWGVPIGGVTSVNSVTGAITAAHIATAVEAASGSNTFTDADHTKLNAIEASADVTDTTNVTAAGALMDSELAGIAAVKATTGTFLTADQTKLDGIEALADVTDTTNVVAALSAGTGVGISGSGVISVTAVALTTVQTAANQTAHLALTAQEGDIVVRSDENKTYCHNGGSAGSMADYTLLATPTDTVLSVAGNTGAVTAAQIATAVEAASDSNTFTDADHTKLNAITAGANLYVHPNHSGEVTSTADGATVIADNIVDEANLKISNTPSNGQFLSAQSGNSGGLTWATVDTSTLLPLAGGAMTGAITTNSTFDGVDIATRDAILTSTTTTAGAALPKAGGTMTGTVIAPSFTSTAGGTFTTASGNDLNIVYPDSRSLFIKEAGTTHVTVDNTGNVGIGTTSPSYPFHLLTSNTGAIAKFESNGANSMWVEIDGGADRDVGLRFDEDGTNRWTIYSKGSSGTNQMEFVNESGTTKLRLNQDGTTTINGALTATSFSGSGSGLTGIDVATVATTAPSSPSAGDLWFDSTSNKNSMMTWNGSGWDQLSNKYTATGGTISTYTGYKVHTFNSSGTFSSDFSGSVDILVIAGGGGGGKHSGGGGGGGGLIYKSSYTLAAGSYAITIGSGGAGRNTGSYPTDSGGEGATGSDTTFGSILTAKGGGGGGFHSGNGTTGGSSGGSARALGAADSALQPSESGASAGFGNVGGSSSISGMPYPGAGGGGAGAAGSNSTSQSGGNGGAGKAYSIKTGSSATYAGGGGGNVQYTGYGSSGTGGSGGGGAAGGPYSGTSGAGTDGGANTGGGGGGHRYDMSAASGKNGNGGSGLVIVRYAT